MESVRGPDRIEELRLDDGTLVVHAPTQRHAWIKSEVSFALLECR